MSYRLLAVLGGLAAAFVLAAHAADQAPIKIAPKSKGEIKRGDDADPKIKIGDAANQQEALKRRFDDFKQQLLALAQRMENSAKPEDREKAKILRQAIKKASEEGVETQFSSLIDMLRSNDAFKNTEQLQSILAENEKLRKNLRSILELLLKDDRDAELRRQREETQRLLEELKNVIRKQEIVWNKTQIGRTKSDDLAKSQNKVRNDTHDLVNPKSDRSKEPKQGEGKDSKSGKKDIGEAKNDAKDPKADPKESKNGENKEGKGPKTGENKEAKGGENKDGKPSEGKGGKPGDNKENKPAAGKPNDSKGNPGKSGQGKPSDSKGKGEGKGDSKGSSGKPSQGKSGEGKPSKGGQSGQSGQQSESKNDGKKGGQSPQQQQPSSEQAQIKKQIEDAQKHQQDAENKLRKDQRKDAPEEQEKALDDLRAAQKKLEDLLRQLREEEIERLLTKLEARCRHMLAMQIAVRDGTVELDKAIQANPKSEATRADQQASNVLSDKEEEIVKEANAGLRLLEAEGSAVAFAEVFQQVRGDMQTVAIRLRKTDTGVVTVTIENQIIDTLQEMIDALKKAIADNKNKKQPPPGQSGPPPDPKLIDLLAELKMIRSMQKRVNARTELYGKQYAGEQAPPPEKANSPDERERYDRIQTELKDLSKRQEKIGKVTHDIATGKNEAK